MGDKIKRLVVKIGTSSLVASNGKTKIHVIEQLADVMSHLNQNQFEMILVTSGAVGIGMEKLGINQRPNEINALQALSSIGQVRLMQLYSEQFNHFDQEIAQILLTRDVVDYPQSHHNVLQTINTLLKNNVVPIINENDAVSVSEFHHHTTFGENDQLAAIVTNLVDADMLVILSDIDGLYTDNPKQDKNAKLIHWVSNVDDKLLQVAGGYGSQFGTGGMLTKLKAAKLILDNQKEMVILNGQDPKIIDRLINGEDVGTLFSAVKPKGR